MMPRAVHLLHSRLASSPPHVSFRLPPLHSRAWPARISTRRGFFLYQSCRIIAHLFPLGGAGYFFRDVVCQCLWAASLGCFPGLLRQDQAVEMATSSLACMLHIINLSLVPDNLAVRVRLMRLSYPSLTPAHPFSRKSLLINFLVQGPAARAWSPLAARLERYTEYTMQVVHWT